MFTVTLSEGPGGRGGELKKGSRPRARPHSGRWHWFPRFGQTSSANQNYGFRFGLKAAAEFTKVGMPAWLGGEVGQWGGGLSATLCPGLHLLPDQDQRGQGQGARGPRGGRHPPPHGHCPFYANTSPGAITNSW